MVVLDEDTCTETTATTTATATSTAAAAAAAAANPKGRGTKRSRETATNNNPATEDSFSSTSSSVEKRHTTSQSPRTTAQATTTATTTTTTATAASNASNHHHNNHNSFAETYVEFASSFVFDKITKRLGNYHQFPLEHMSALAYLKSPVRKPSILEIWSPLEIALFEASLAVHGKEFHTIQRHIGTKTTKQIIDLYYIWKKTSHYRKWKKEFVPADFDSAAHNNPVNLDRGRTDGDTATNGSRATTSTRTNPKTQLGLTLYESSKTTTTMG